MYRQYEGLGPGGLEGSHTECHLSSGCGVPVRIARRLSSKGGYHQTCNWKQ